MTAIIKAKEAMDRKRLTAFELTRNWFDFAFENPEKVNVMQTALFMWLIEANNRTGWAMKFAFNTEDACFATGVSNRKTVWKALNELVENGFVVMVYKSSHKHKPTVISLMSELKETDGSLDNALLNLSEKRTGTETVSGLVTPQYGNGTETVSGHSLKHENHKPQTGKHENIEEGASAIPSLKNEIDFEEEKIIPLKSESEASEEKEKKGSAQKKEKDAAIVEFTEIYKQHFPEYAFKPPRDEPYLKSIYERIKRGFNAVSQRPPTTEEAASSFTMLIENLDKWHVENGYITPKHIDKNFETHKAYLKKSKSSSQPNALGKYDLNKIISRKFE